MLIYTKQRERERKKGKGKSSLFFKELFGSHLGQASSMTITIMDMTLCSVVHIN